ncbi:hypothetical protein [Syntrophaceticus schinkii]|uniref:hypothetical protein n=1 Tax=Syntrophaceticus schinkii TaxID=499207 RepID=UPI0012EC1999|nr:hypothetical protein [Syntrophaceticus schinkii]
MKETFISISAESNRLKLYTSLNPYDLNQHSLIISDAINAGLRSLLPIGIAVLLFASISMVVSLLSFLRKKHKRNRRSSSCGSDNEEYCSAHPLDFYDLFELFFCFSNFDQQSG